MVRVRYPPRFTRGWTDESTHQALLSHHNLTVVGVDDVYTKPLTRDYMRMSPGQAMQWMYYCMPTMNLVIFLAAKAFLSGVGVYCIILQFAVFMNLKARWRGYKYLYKG
ncbi:hypothetical protein VNO80_05567 [Phaseolus coccineus]|uniref:Plastocyanin-like domain-containing protein n=1 Tax=Phaseolus coccineus TaxID=3886 RepID=A0AAN9NFA4_PHACN